MPTPRRSRALLVLTVSAALATTVSAASAGVSGSSVAGAVRAPDRAERAARTTTPEARGFFDVRLGVGRSSVATRQVRAARAARGAQVRALRSELGRSAVLDFDGTTGTVRTLIDPSGTLTGRSSSPARTVVSRYLAQWHTALGLTSADVRTLRLRTEWVDVAGIHHLSYIQRLGGQTVFGNGLKAAVDRTGRLLTIGGSPISSPAAPPATRGTDRVTDAAAALREAMRATGERAVRPGPSDVAEPVLLVTAARTYRAWRVVAMSAQQPSLSVLDRATGRLLYYRSLSSDASAREPDPKAGSTRAGDALIFPNFPGHKPGGKQVRVNFAARGWLPARAPRLFGNNARVWSDVNDDNLVQKGEEVGPKPGFRWTYALKPFSLKNVSYCKAYVCSWNPDKPYSWRTNRRQNAVQTFFFVNNFHDHLLASPIGFTEAAGNFQQRNKTKRGVGGDQVRTQTDDGANTADGLPDGNHIDNANMNTPPDGIAPTMQMYLQHQPGTPYPDGDPFPPNNVGDSADTVYHEYTHGLSNRLVIDATGVSTLGGVQAGSMGEAWSDWYALDYLVGRKLYRDTAKAELTLGGGFDGAGTTLVRTEPIDCTVGDTTPRCTGGASGHTGGYTYADYGQVGGGPEVHDDGEVWGQTLWDLRRRYGQKVAETLITRAMSLAPSNPSFLDMRDAILLAGEAVYYGRYRDGIYATFAHRGMGFYAGSLGGDDTTPAADFHTKPVTSGSGYVSGVVTDQDTGLPVAGVPVTLAFQGSGTANPTDVTGADGRYTLGPVPAGPYGKLVVNGAGYEPATAAVAVTPSGATTDFEVRRDWAASSGGGSIDDFNGPDYTDFGCGPGGAIDLSQGTGWGSTTGNDNGDPTGTFVPKFITVELPRTINVTGFAVDPSATCGDGGSASTGQYKIETSPDGTTFTPGAAGTFTEDDRGRLNPVGPTGGTAGVRFVRFTILSNQTPDFATNCPGGAYSGCSFSDLTELEVFGVPTA